MSPEKPGEISLIRRIAPGRDDIGKPGDLLRVTGAVTAWPRRASSAVMRAPALPEAPMTAIFMSGLH